MRERTALEWEIEQCLIEHTRLVTNRCGCGAKTASAQQFRSHLAQMLGDLYMKVVDG